MTRAGLFAAAAVAAVCAGSAASAQELEKPNGFPERPITVIVPYGAGGGSDQVARAWASAMEDVTGVPLTVENKPGGGGLAALPDFLSRPHDGYTILEQSDTLPSAVAAGQVGPEMMESIVPICFTQATFNQIYILPNEDRFSDWDSLVAYMKEHPGEVTMANIGVEGSMEQLQVEALEDATGIKFKQISFDKPTERYAALLGGHSDVLLEQPGDVRAYLEAEQMRPVLSISQEKPGLFEDVPALPQAGLEEVPVLQRIRGFWVPHDIPEERREYLIEACDRAANTEEYQAFNEEQFMHLTRSFYGGEDAIRLAEDMRESYEELYGQGGAK